MSEDREQDAVLGGRVARHAAGRVSADGLVCEWGGVVRQQLLLACWAAIGKLGLVCLIELPAVEAYLFNCCFLSF